ncbi:MAG: hydantoinase/oxoprolinase family protein [bacterium]
MNYRLGVDIGGTFTDLLLVAADGRTHIGKTLTTADPSQGIETAVAESLRGTGIGGGERGILVHATTLATNAILERSGPPTALLATAGFRDALEIGREHRFDLYDLNLEFPRPLIPRYLRFDVPERIAADGAVLRPLDEGFLRRLAAGLAAKGIRAVAVCYLHSFRNPVHERRTGEIMAEVAPEIAVSLSAEVAPEIREFQRASTTAVNAYVQERVAGYLDGLRERAAAAGFHGEIFVMLSSGSIGTVETASRFPVRLLESGPAAGALAAAALGGRAGFADLLSFDMGGTTAKLCAVQNGAPLQGHEFEVDRVYRFRRGSGLPVSIPVIDMIEIGAGGGSIARRSPLGLLTVGPDSAGADPGPACYGRGGREPTVTDADLLLGYLAPGYFLGGKMRLDVAAAREAVAAVARPLGLTVEGAAWGIHQIVNEHMAGAARAHLNERGLTPGRLPIFAFGGAGPVHAYRVAEILRTSVIIAPPGAGVGSAFGLLAAPLAFELARSGYGRLDDLDWRAANGLLDDLAAEGRDLLARAGLRGDAVSARRSAEMRYLGQGHDVAVALPHGPLGPGRAAEVVAEFERTYQRHYGRLGPRVPLEITNWRVTVSGPRPALDFRMGSTRAAGGRSQKGVRRAYFPEADGFADTPVYDRYALRPGEVFSGPAIVEERESTLVVGPRGRGRVDEHLNVIVELGAHP